MHTHKRLIGQKGPAHSKLVTLSYSINFKMNLLTVICVTKWALCCSSKIVLKSLTDICMMKWVAVVHDVSNSSHELTHSFHEATVPYKFEYDSQASSIIPMFVFFYQTKIKGKKRRGKCYIHNIFTTNLSVFRSLKNTIRLTQVISQVITQSKL